METLHMNKGEGETSYSKNCIVQRQIISFGERVIEEAVAECLVKSEAEESMGIADLGCSSGPNTLTVIWRIINAVCRSCEGMGVAVPELRVWLNDLPCNDFNGVLMLVPEFYRRLGKEKGIGPEGCFVSAVAGSFYGRLFPTNTLHLVHASSSLHWLSQVPLGLKASGINLNKGKIYISKTSPDCVAKAYLSQFQKDFFLFLRSRAEEVVPAGRMVLSFMGRTSPAAAAEVGSHQWELLAHALTSMAFDGLVEEERIDSFNAPYYAPCGEEVRHVIEEEGSFIVNHLEAFEIGWDGGSQDDNNAFGKHDYDNNNPQHLIMSRGQLVSNTIRAVVESMLESHFGAQIMDELFRRYAQLVDHYFSTTVAKHINLVISLTRK